MFTPVAAFSGFSVKDQAEAKEFYTKVLGLTIENEEMGLQFQLPGGGKVFIYAKENHEPATYTVLNFVVNNVDEAIEDLKGKGVSFEHYEGMTDEKGVARGIANHMGPDIAWFKDPAGNI